MMKFDLEWSLPLLHCPLVFPTTSIFVIHYSVFIIPFKYQISNTEYRMMKFALEWSLPLLHCPPIYPYFDIRYSRSEERRVGKKCRSRWSQYYYKKKYIRII